MTIAELIRGVAIALGTSSTGDCPAFANGDGVVDIAQLVKGVASALNGCGALEGAAPAAPGPQVRHN